MPLNIEQIRAQFPILQQKVFGKPLIYFDNAATTQKPIAVVDALQKYYYEYNSNIHRGVHHLSQLATTAYEESRLALQKFVNAKFSHEIIFTRGTTESINLVAFCYAERFITTGDEIIISAMEHHSNIVPWQMACERKGAILKVIPIDDNGVLCKEELEKLINKKTKLIALTHISNVLGTVNPIKEIIVRAHQSNIPVLIDGAQAAPHMPIDVQDLDCDFYCLSGHKMYGPTGIGILYGKEKYLNEMPPYQGGGDMIEEVRFEKTTYNSLPLKYEAGTQSIADAIGLKAAVEYINSLGIENIANWEHELLQYTTKKLLEIEDIKIYGTAKDKASTISFLIKGIHPYDAGTMLDKYGIAIRTGHHCAQPLMERFGISGTMRASFAVYNTKEEVDNFIDYLKKVITLFK